MDVHQIEMPREEALEKLQAYKKRLSKMKGRALASEIGQEYQAAMEGYKALAAGTALIDLDEIFEACPCDEQGRPMMAIGRADRKQIYMEWEGWSDRIRFIDEANRYSRLAQDSLLQRSVLMGRGHGQTDLNGYRKTLSGYSLIPMIPADVRPAQCDLSKSLILWEVEKWADQRLRSTPDRDPFLLKPIGGSLYAVIAQWDLTDLERSIMKRRLS